MQRGWDSSLIATGSSKQNKGNDEMISDFFGNRLDDISYFFGSIVDWLEENLTTDGPWPALLAVVICTVVGIVTL